jgi:hypothetical protein
MTALRSGFMGSDVGKVWGEKKRKGIFLGKSS